MKTRRNQVIAVVVCCLLALSSVVSAVDFPILGTIPSGITYDAVEEVYTVGAGALPNEGFHFIYAAKVDFVAGSALPADNWIVTGDDCVVNFYDCIFEPGSIVYIAADSLGGGESYTGDVTFHGTDFAINGVGLKSGDTLPTNVTYDNDNGKLFCTEGNVLSGNNANGEYFEVNLTCLHYGSLANPIPPMMYCNLVWLDEPSVIDVDIDIKPDSTDNMINLGSQGVIPVAILSTPDFDALYLVDAGSLVLGGASVAVRGKSDKLMSHAEDVNGDGYVDLVCQFDSENFAPGVEQEGTVYLEGTCYDETPIKGEDWIIVVPPAG